MLGIMKAMALAPGLRCAAATVRVAPSHVGAGAAAGEPERSKVFSHKKNWREVAVFLRTLFAYAFVRTLRYM